MAPIAYTSYVLDPHLIIRLFCYNTDITMVPKMSAI